MKFRSEIWMVVFLISFLESSTSQKYYSIDTDVCNKFSLLNLYNKYTINLESPVTSVIIQNSFNSSTYKRFKRDCAFKIVSENSGIYVNIRKMKLRQNAITGECYDSLLIKYSDDVKHRFCGDLKDQQIKSIEDLKGSVKITLSIDNLRAFTDTKDVLEFSVVATAFTGNINNFHQTFKYLENLFI